MKRLYSFISRVPQEGQQDGSKPSAALHPQYYGASVQVAKQPELQSFNMICVRPVGQLNHELGLA